MGTTKDAERKILVELTGLLLKNAEKVLEGETKVCLTTSSLEILVSNFRRYSERGEEDRKAEESSSREQKRHAAELKQWKESIRTLIDFVLKIKALKIINSTHTMRAPIQVARFSSLQVLEVKKVPIHMLEGLSKLRGQLKELIVSRSLEELKGILEVCGGDRASGLVWSCLTVAYLGFNDLGKLDNSLRLVPFLEVLDLSHNNLKETGNFLKSLTDVVKIVLGYNHLSTVPQLSVSNKMKLRTLVLRNNSLDNLEGLEEMLMLEELDVSENCFVDHKVLRVLSGLHRLRVLYLAGNPLCYKTNHRHLTLKKLSPQTAMVPITLDRQSLTPIEISIVRQNQYNKRKSVIDIHIEDEGDGMETILVSQGRGGTTGNTLNPNYDKNKKRGHRRIHSKERIPRIGNIQDSMDDEYTSTDVSPTMSYKEETDLMAEVEKDKMKYEILREHYKDDWLKALSAEQGRYNREPENMDQDFPDNTKDGDKFGEKSGTETAEAKDKEDETKENTSKADDAQSPNQEGKSNVDEEPRVTESPLSPKFLHIVDTTDIYARMSSRQMESVAAPVAVRVEKEVEEEEIDTDNEEQYGSESEPLIVMLPNREMKQIFVTVNNRYITEKDTDGKKLTSLDLKCLQSILRKEEELNGKDIVGVVRFTVMTLNFDYVKKDMRQRKYAMEDDNDAVILESLIYPHIKAKEEKGKMQMECLRCKHQFFQQSSEDTSIPSCPSCKSKMVIKMDTAGHGAEVSSVEPPGSESPTLQRPKTTSLRNSPAQQRKRFSPQTFKEIESSDTESGQKLQSSTFEGSLSDYVDKLIPVDDDGTKDKADRRKGLFRAAEDGSHPFMMEKSGSSTDTISEAMKTNNSWSDVRKSVASQSMTRSSISSVDSDITVLTTNSKGSVSVISESSHEVIKGEHIQSTRTRESLNMSESDLADQRDFRTRTENADSTSVNLKKNAQVLITPVGSPLSNSVCSSMVSSVYENTLSASGEEQLNSTNDSRNITVDTGSLTGSSSDSISIRHSLDSTETRSRRSKHRHATLYIEETENRSDSSNSKIDSREISGDVSSIYNTAKSRQDDLSLNSTKASVEKSFPSIYDKMATDSDSGKPDETDSFMSPSHKSSDHLTPSQESSSHSSPRKRSGNRSRSRSANRSGIYGESLLEQSGDSQDVTGLPEFPSDLSPIKRVPNQQSTNQATADTEVSQLEVGNEDVVLRNKEDSLNGTSGSGTTGSGSVLPWDLEEKDKAAKHESLIHDEFINIDHRIQLYLELKVLKSEEQIQCAIQCYIVQYMMPKEVKSLLVISSQRILIFRIEGELDSNSSDWLTCYEDQPITELQYIDIGLGYQSMRLEFSTLCSSYTLLICDEARCKQFLTLLSDIVQTTAIHEHSKLEGISKSNPSTVDNLQSEVLEGTPGNIEEEEEGPQQFVRYLMVRYMEPDNEEDEGKILGLVVTTTDLILIQENHQWPLPRLQAPLPENVKGQQFIVLQGEKINNIETFVFNEYDPKELRISFFENTDVDAASVWYINMETTKGVKSLVDAIREPWEEEFGVTLDVTSQSFTED